ncbi:hypothetical protein DEA06_14325 [Microbacterium sp. Gd 4-13]|uniref:hypothetical protein n=1 Tax=Microbacterium sp. Gd 4-13 TaxID=2173179 RepID=UPI000D566C19|nr:hypothetical protein [Microbacterium sp. Gd 4-13]PVW02949.1 hypothetical protein DEA06_14325 [Microbacterium sp. Gd 4-13]
MAVAAFVVVIGFTVGGPANAAEVAPSPPAGETTTDSPPIDTSLPGVAERIAEIEANGGEILGGSSVQYVEEGSGEDGAAQRAFPSGCGLTVLVYKQTTQIVSDNLTSCLAPFVSAAMSSTIGFLAWGHYNNIVASRSAQRTGGSSLALEYAYNCANTSNTTWFRTITNGTLVRGGTTYTAAAYDEVQDDYCGT